MGEQFWMGEGPEYPHTVLDSIRDNHSFSELVESFDFVSDRPWFLAWFPEYLHSVRNLSVYGDVLAKVIDFLCEELQQERFLVSRPFTIAVAVKVCQLHTFIARNMTSKRILAVNFGSSEVQTRGFVSASRKSSRYSGKPCRHICVDRILEAI